jgi:hypothetical protein
MEDVEYVKNASMTTQAVVGNESVKQAVIIFLPHHSNTNAPIQRHSKSY